MNELAAANTDQLPAQSTQLQEVCNLWVDNFVSEQTRTTYAKAINEFLSFTQFTSLDQLARQVGMRQIVDWRDALRTDGAADATINNRLSALSSLYRFLCDKQLAPRNPVTGIKRPRVASHTVKTSALTAPQVRALLDAPDTTTLQGLRDRALLHVYFYTGVRVSEPCKLRVRDFHQDQGYWVLDFKTKGGKENRVAIHPECHQAVQHYVDSMKASSHDTYGRDDWLFQPMKNGKTGKPLTRFQLNQLFQKYARLADLPEGITPHSARATFITEALGKQHPPQAVQHTVNHASITTTLAYDKSKQEPKNSASFVVRY